jgi:glutathione S-transferase
MPFDYISVEDAIPASGLRMVVVSGVPSPWGEAAKGIFHIKQIPWSAVRLTYDNEALKAWAGQTNGPIAVYNQEAPRAGWAEILFLAERLAPTPSLIPSNPEERALMLGLSHEVFGEEGLAWARRIQLVQAGLEGKGGFNPRVAKYIGAKYGHSAEAGAAAGARVIGLLIMLATRLKAQKARGYATYFDTLTALDVYSATAMALFGPLPEEAGAMSPQSRAAFETIDAQTTAALDPILFEHRAMMYAKHLELPLSL